MCFCYRLQCQSRSRWPLLGSNLKRKKCVWITLLNRRKATCKMAPEHFSTAWTDATVGILRPSAAHHRYENCQCVLWLCFTIQSSGVVPRFPFDAVTNGKKRLMSLFCDVKLKDLEVSLTCGCQCGRVMWDEHSVARARTVDAHGRSGHTSSIHVQSPIFN